MQFKRTIANSELTNMLKPSKLVKSYFKHFPVLFNRELEITSFKWSFIFDFDWYYYCIDSVRPKFHCAFICAPTSSVFYLHHCALYLSHHILTCSCVFGHCTEFFGGFFIKNKSKLNNYGLLSYLFVHLMCHCSGRLVQ